MHPFLARVIAILLTLGLLVDPSQTAFFAAPNRTTPPTQFLFEQEALLFKGSSLSVGKTAFAAKPARELASSIATVASPAVDPNGHDRDRHVFAGIDSPKNRYANRDPLAGPQTPDFIRSGRRHALPPRTGFSAETQRGHKGTANPRRSVSIGRGITIEDVVKDFEAAIGHTFKPETRRYFSELLRSSPNSKQSFQEHALRFLGGHAYHWAIADIFMDHHRFPSPAEFHGFIVKAGSFRVRLRPTHPRVAAAFRRYEKYAQSHHVQSRPDWVVALWIAGLLAAEEDVEALRTFIHPFFEDMKPPRPLGTAGSTSLSMQEKTPALEAALMGIKRMTQGYLPATRNLDRVLPNIADFKINQGYAVYGDAILGLIIAKKIWSFSMTHPIPHNHSGAIANTFSDLTKDQTLAEVMAGYVDASKAWREMTYETLVAGIFMGHGKGPEGLRFATRFVVDTMDERVPAAMHKVVVYTPSPTPLMDENRPPLNSPFENLELLLRALHETKGDSKSQEASSNS